MRGRCGASQLRIAFDDRFVDATVLFACLVQRVVGGAAVPQADSHGASREAGQERGEDRVSGGPGDDRMERDVRFHQLLDGLRGAHLLETAPQLNLLVAVDARRGQAGGGCFQDASDLVKLHSGLAEQKVADEVSALEQQVGLEAAHVRAVALADLEHPKLRQGSHRFP